MNCEICGGTKFRPIQMPIPGSRVSIAVCERCGEKHISYHGGYFVDVCYPIGSEPLGKDGIEKASEDVRAEVFKGLLGSVLSDNKIELLKQKGFFSAPASAKYHGAYAGGLFDHSYVVADTLVQLTHCNSLKWERVESPYIVGVLHDLCKIDQYLLSKDGTSWEYNNNCELKGHGDKSVILLSQYMELTEEEIFAIRYHMGAFVEKNEWRDYTNAVKKYPNVLWVHTVDMIAAHIYDT